MRTGQSQKNREYKLAFLWLMSCTFTWHQGNELSHAFCTRLPLFPFEYGIWCLGQHKSTSVLFPGLLIVCCLSGTPLLKSKSRKGQMGNIQLTQLEGHISISHKGDTFARPTVRFCQTRGFTHHARRMATCLLPIRGVQVCRRMYLVHDTFVLGSLQRFFSLHHVSILQPITDFCTPSRIHMFPHALCCEASASFHPWELRPHCQLHSASKELRENVSRFGRFESNRCMCSTRRIASGH